MLPVLEGPHALREARARVANENKLKQLDYKMHPIADVALWAPEKCLKWGDTLRSS